MVKKSLCITLGDVHVQKTNFLLSVRLLKLNAVNIKVDSYHKCSFMYLLTKWEGRMEKYLARGHGVRTERSEVRAP